MSGTFDDFADITTSRNPSSSRILRCPVADLTSASGTSIAPASSSPRSPFSKEPRLTPILIGTFFSFAALTTASTLSREPMLPGLILSASAPASIAASAQR